MQHFVFFIGRFHVLVLHVPITLVLVVATMEWLGRGGKHPELDPALRALWAATALSALLTAVLGYMHFSEGGFTGPSAYAHRALGTSVALVATFAWGLARRAGGVLQRLSVPIAAVLVALVVATGHFGGNLTHGNAYLVEYAPREVRHLLGLQDARKRVTDMAAADPYLDIVHPMLQARCSSCHNPTKRRGGLDLSTYASTMEGGKDGSIVTIGHAESSDLIRRVSLTPDQDDFMPREGKAALTADQIAILKWWIDAGAKTGSPLSVQRVPAAVKGLMEAQFRLASSPASAAAGAAAGGQGGEDETIAAPKSADPKRIDALAAAGLMARQVSATDPHLIVTPITPGSALGPTQIRAVVSAGDLVTELDLRNGRLDGSALATLSGLPNLTRLRLDRNQLNDQAVRMIPRFDKLEVLGLYGNAGITDASITTLAQMHSLRRIYLWQTGITARGVDKLKSLKPDLQVDDGDAESLTAARTPTPGTS